MAPRCDLCPNTHAKRKSWCGGNCQFDYQKNECTEKGKVYLNIQLCTIFIFKVKSLLVYRKNYMSILFCYVVDEYTKVEESWCFSGQGYGSLLEAKYNCSLDSTCVGVLDEDCKNDYSFYLCHGDFEKVKTFRSCIYKKKDLVGKQRWPSKTFIQILFTY